MPIKPKKECNLESITIDYICLPQANKEATHKNNIISSNLTSESAENKQKKTFNFNQMQTQKNESNDCYKDNIKEKHGVEETKINKTDGNIDMIENNKEIQEDLNKKFNFVKISKEHKEDQIKDFMSNSIPTEDKNKEINLIEFLDVKVFNNGNLNSKKEDKANDPLADLEEMFIE